MEIIYDRFHNGVDSFYCTANKMFGVQEVMIFLFYIVGTAYLISCKNSCCNRDVSVLCSFQNYLLTYLFSWPTPIRAHTSICIFVLTVLLQSTIVKQSMLFYPNCIIIFTEVEYFTDCTIKRTTMCFNLLAKEEIMTTRDCDKLVGIIITINKQFLLRF